MAGHDVVERQVVGLAAAVLAGVPVAAEDLAPGQLDPRPRAADLVLEPDDRGRLVDGADRADLGVVVLDDLRLGAEHQPERPRDVADVQGLVVLVQHEHDPVHRPNDSSTASSVRRAAIGGREPGRGGGAGGDLPSDPRRVHRPLDAGDLDLDPADLGRRLLPLVAPERGGVAPAARLGVLVEERLAGRRGLRPGGGSVSAVDLRCIGAKGSARRPGARRARPLRAALARRVRPRGRPGRPCRAGPGPRAGPARTSARPRGGPCG